MERRGAVRTAQLALICDTSVVYGAVDRHDDAHARCAHLLTSSQEEIVLPAPVIVELDWLAMSRREPSIRNFVLDSVGIGSISVAELRAADYSRIAELCRRYGNLPLGLVDASVVAIAERLGEPKVATLDHRHFSVVRPRHVRSLQLLPD